MNECKHYTPEEERAEVYKLAREYCAMVGEETPGKIEATYQIWCGVARLSQVSVLEEAKGIMNDFRLEVEADEESTTLMERRKRHAAICDMSLEEYEEACGAFDLHLEDLEWLQTKTGEKNKKLSAIIEQFNETSNQWANAYDFIDQEKENGISQDRVEALNASKKELEALENKLNNQGNLIEKAIITEKRRLQHKLLLINLEARYPNVRIKINRIRKNFRTRTRAYRSPRKASSSVASSSSGDSDPDQPEPPSPQHTLLNSQPNRTPSPWLSLGCCCIVWGWML